MTLFLTILIVLASVLLVLLVLVQNSKGGGLASGFQSGNQVMGAPKTADFLEKASWTLAAVIIVLSILAVWVYKNDSANVNEGSAISTQVQEAAESMQVNAPAADFSEEAAEQAE